MFFRIAPKRAHRSATRDQVVTIYKTMLGREPESEAVIESHMASGDATDVMRIVASSPEFQSRTTKSPFSYYNSMFDAESIVRRHALQDLQADPAYITNFLGVKVDPKVAPEILSDRVGQVEPIPITANWHADITEWAAALRSVEFANDTFSMAELGCGWGCWIINTGVAARALGLAVDLIGVEGDEGSIARATEATRLNGIRDSEVTIHRGVAAASDGIALFERPGTSVATYGIEPIFGATQDQRDAAVASGRYDELRMIPLSDVVGDRSRLDLLHLDIQGGEADLVHDSLSLLADKVAYVLIGTHSREIEGRLINDLHSVADWRLEIERPAIFDLSPTGPVTTIDGVQGWRNLRLLPDD
jgi:hypothetical protein